MFSKFHDPPTPFSASEKAKPALPCAIASPIVAYRFGPTPLAPPCVIVWQAAHFLKTSAPLAASAVGSSVAMSTSAAPPPAPSSSTPSIA